MEKQPFFSIGIPVYNTAPYLKRCMDSIYSQSFTDFEIIFVDDGSSDNSLEVLKEYAAKDDRITVITRPNDGPSSARNAMLYTARGKYIYVLDSDDAMCEEVLAKAYAELEKNNFPDLLHTGFIRVTDGVETVVPVKPLDEEFFDPSLSKDERWIEMWLSQNFFEQVMPIFIRCEFIKNSGIAFSDCLFDNADRDFNIDIYCRAKTIVYDDILSFRYFKDYQDGSLFTEGSCPSIANMLSYWSKFYRNIEFYDISDKTRQLIVEKKEGLLRQLRSEALDIATQCPKEECFKLINLLDRYFGREIENLSVNEGGINGIIFRMYKIFGLKRTYKWLYACLKKGNK